MSDNTNVVIENAPFETEALNEALENARGSQLTETQEASVNGEPKEMVTAVTVEGDQPYTTPSLETIASLYGEGDITHAELVGMIDNGEHTFEEISSVINVESMQALRDMAMAEENEPEPSKEVLEQKRGIGDNSFAQYAYMVEGFQNFDGISAHTPEAAKDNLLAALENTAEHELKGNTSLTAQVSISVADWLHFNLVSGNGMTMGRLLYSDVQKKIGEFVSKDDQTEYFKNIVGQSIKRAILVIMGKLQIGYFCLPGNKRQHANDVALPAYPTDVAEGYRVLESVVIRDDVLRPTLIHTVGEVVQSFPNQSQALRFVTNDVANALYESLWDLEGKLQYDPKTGIVNGFKSAAMLAKEEADRKVKEAADKAAQEAKNKAPESRETGGTQSENNAKATLESVKAELVQERQDKQALMDERKGDIVLGLAQIGAMIRDERVSIPDEAQVVLLHDAVDLIKRRVLGTNKTPSREKMLEMVRLHHILDNYLNWNDKLGTWSWGDTSDKFKFETSEIN